MEDSSNCDTACDGESVGVILNQMTTVLNIDSFSCSDCDASSVVSMKEGCGSPMSSWDSEPETDISSAISCHVMPDESLQDVDLEGNYPDSDSEEENQFVGVENNDDGFSWEMDNRSYEELLKKFIEKEEELRVSNFMLQLSEQEIIGLKVQVENSESQINDMHEKLELKEDELYEQKELSDKEIFKLRTQIENSESQLDNVHKESKLNKCQLLVMHKKLNLKNAELDNVRGELNLKNGQLDNVREELKLKGEELNEQKELLEKEIFKLKTQITESENQVENVREELSLKKEELQKQTAELDNHIPECVNKITNLMEQLKEAQKKLKTSKNEIATELNSKTSMIHQLKCQTKEQKKYIASLECNVDALVIAKKDTDINHKEELKKLNSKLLEMQVMLSWEREKTHADTAMLSARLSNMKKQLSSKVEELESRNKELEKKVMVHEGEKSNQKKLHSAQVKLLQDEISCLKKELGQRMKEVEAANKESSKVMAEINEANGKVDKLESEICSRGDQISHMKKHIDELNTSLKELGVHYRTKVNDENKLIMRVEELEKEVTNKNGVILEKAEEKKEAIRQLWRSLESNWSGYSDLFKR